ncbi:hypothetical protein ACFXPV_28260 [Streptomyces sp. NPDC059118]|uniref:hypothetical protein n=1 Tax=unclassified Streptomyces TaxID=2593676 RepID=UPI0036C7E6F4
MCLHEGQAGPCPLPVGLLIVVPSPRTGKYIGTHGLGTGIVALALLSTGSWARETSKKAAALFEEVGRGHTSSRDHRRGGDE